MDTENNPHIKLALMGSDAWNRWVRTVMSDEELDALRVDDDRKNSLKLIEPLSDEEKNNLASVLSLVDFDDLNCDINFSDLTVECDFTGVIFPGNADFTGVTFSNIVDFEGAIFSGDTGFQNATFSGITSFQNATFSGITGFQNATFSGYVAFKGVTFSNIVDFEGAIFSRYADFEGATFSGVAAFEWAMFCDSSVFRSVTFSGDALFRGVKFGGSFNEFEEPSFINAEFYDRIDFTEAVFSTPPLFHNVDLHQDTTFYQAKYLTIGRYDHRDQDMRAWRTLKIAMNKTHHHEQELMYFSFEMDAKRVSLINEKKWMSWLVISCYKWFSGYGQSLIKPFIAIAVAWVLFAVVYSLWMEGGLLSFITIIKGHQFSLSNLLPFVPTSKAVMDDVFKGDISLVLQILTVFQNIFSTVMLFLIGLALRHRFIIK